MIIVAGLGNPGPKYEKNRHKPVKVCKAVYPRVAYDPKGKSSRDMPFASCTFISSQRGEDQVILEEGGYRKFPFGISRYMTAPNEVYARGPAHDALADILTLQAMARTTLRYITAITEEADAAGEYEKMRALREAAAAKIEAWRTESSNYRSMKI